MGSKSKKRVDLRDQHNEDTHTRCPLRGVQPQLTRSTGKKLNQMRQGSPLFCFAKIQPLILEKLPFPDSLMCTSVRKWRD